MASSHSIKDQIASLISEFSEQESNAPYEFDIDCTERKRDNLIIVRIVKTPRKYAFWKTAFIIKTEAELDIFRSFLSFLSSATLQQKF